MSYFCACLLKSPEYVTKIKSIVDFFFLLSFWDPVSCGHDATSLLVVLSQQGAVVFLFPDVKTSCWLCTNVFNGPPPFVTINQRAKPFHCRVADEFVRVRMTDGFSVQNASTLKTAGFKNNSFCDEGWVFFELSRVRLAAQWVQLSTFGSKWQICSIRAAKTLRWKEKPKLWTISWSDNVNLRNKTKVFNKTSQVKHLDTYYIPKAEVQSEPSI